VCVCVCGCCVDVCGGGGCVFGGCVDVCVMVM
jgi:hypothetical protein